MMSFKRPLIGPKAYLAEGSSGWMEQFPRAATDCALDDFINDFDVEVLVDTFLLGIEVRIDGKRSPIVWDDVVAFLARIKEIPQALIPANVAVGFWVKVLLADTAKGTN